MIRLTEDERRNAFIRNEVARIRFTFEKMLREGHERCPALFGPVNTDERNPAK